ncbi:Aste57867_1576 [Aphanomyces stellatus]|uniref:Aste57867_1576 protein n=1 Tax=Aphanomyces stellatus TaxID=120398 RepID=A0A485K5F2_9STRA|nr:hypothetical protein As57867_001575 [Aphanomyces stellatus]VFT78789.1 Aste57867_1576 [Aphanomyces stellatus]
MDGCQLPWIATAYCYADFNQRWAMAYSARRQQRCQDERANGAVFLEAILRNADWPSLNACWGSALTTAVLAPIQASGNDGVAWFKSVQGNALSVAAEVASWRATGIDRFTTQWQNYKRLGVVETFAVKSALGLDYPFTLKDFSSAFQQSSTSLKWYWGFANDLRAIASNSSVLAGRSLIQRTPHYAFENTTLEAAMVRQLVVPTPMDPGLALVIASVGPFGVVDLRRVAVPQALRDLYRRMSQFLTSKLAASEAIQTAFWPLMTTTNYGPQPSIWDNGVMFGGNIHCGVNLATPSDNQVNEYFSAAGVCPNNLPEHVTSSTQDVLLAILAVGFAHMHNATTWTTVGKRGSAHAAAVVQTLNSSTTFLADHFYENELGQFDADVAPVQAAIRDTVQLEFVQFLRLRGAGPYVFSHVNVFAATEPDLAFFTWLYLFDWVQGTREVISLVGDMGTITTISTFQNVVQHPTNAFEIQTHSSLYLYSLIVYITALLVAVGVVVIVYYTSMKHLVVDKRIGRPLMLLRSVTALAILATASLTKAQSGMVASFASPARSALTTILSSAEISWLVYVTIDTFSVVTMEYTGYYSLLSCVVVSLAVMIWSFVVPPTHAVDLVRSCTVVAVDFDVVCASGTVRIGDSARFWGLVGVAVGGTLASFVVVRVLPFVQPPKLKPLSFFFYSAARHEFERVVSTHWEHHGVYYLDKASAVLTGVLTFEHRGAIYLFDIKTWRIYTISRREMASRGLNLPAHLVRALPLTK